MRNLVRALLLIALGCVAGAQSFAQKPQPTPTPITLPEDKRESVTVRLNDMRRAGMIDFVDRKILLKHPPDFAPV